jgi:hypothetical protein
MADHMKTTVEISDPLLREAKAIARREGLTVRALMEHGLSLALAERRKRKEFRLRDGSVSGSGLQPETSALSWDQLRQLSYEGRGG